MKVAVGTRHKFMPTLFLSGLKKGCYCGVVARQEQTLGSVALYCVIDIAK